MPKVGSTQSKQKRIQFIRDTTIFDWGEIHPDTFLVYRDGFYKLPSISGVEYLKFTEFKEKYFSINANKYIFIGLNRIINPSNRCEMVFDHMQSMTRNIEKISVDTEPFLGEPWRLWYHYDMTNSDKFGVPHGYAIETEWQHWFYQKITDCRLSANNLDRYIGGTYSDLDELTTTFEFSEVSSEDLSWYEKMKEHVFSSKNTPKTVINQMLKLCNERYELKISYDSFRSNEKIDVPDNKLYRFVVQENCRRMGIWNKVVECGKICL
tara:strand:+ start:28 stop:825 length:798 start_codon:yes stop_codon:yes gene_type:complete